MADNAPDDASERGDATLKAAEADYAMLADMIKHQHERINNHTTMFMSILTALVGFVVWFIAEHTEMSVVQCRLIRLASWGGFLASLAWLLVLCRILADTDLRYFQLRFCERVMQREHKIFTEGKRFFEEHVIEAPDRKEKALCLCFLARCPVKRTMQCLAGVYCVVFLVVVIFILPAVRLVPAP